MNDSFFVSVDTGDVKFDQKMTAKWLEEIGGKNIEIVEAE